MLRPLGSGDRSAARPFVCKISTLPKRGTMGPLPPSPSPPLSRVDVIPLSASRASPRERGPRTPTAPTPPTRPAVKQRAKHQRGVQVRVGPTSNSLNIRKDACVSDDTRHSSQLEVQLPVFISAAVHTGLTVHSGCAVRPAARGGTNVCDIGGLCV